uniref:zinc finger protein 530-like n=1 Tax=Myxine glutinosa TaxID=7769 RepID=UPI00358FF839
MDASSAPTKHEPPNSPYSTEKNPPQVFPTPGTPDPWKCSRCGNVFSTFSLLEDHRCGATQDPLAPQFRVRRQPDCHKTSPAKATPEQLAEAVVGLTVAVNPQESWPGFGGTSEVVSLCSELQEAGTFSLKVEEASPPTPAPPPPLLKHDSSAGVDAGHQGGAQNATVVALGSRPRKAFPCTACAKVFVSVEKLRVHSYAHTGERPFACTSPGCSKAFVSKYKLLRHAATHSPDKTHACPCCGKTFHRKDHLKNHQQTHDPHKLAYRCDSCGKKYHTKLGFRRHLALHAAASGDLTCRVCGRSLECTAALLQHLKARPRHLQPDDFVELPSGVKLPVVPGSTTTFSQTGLSQKLYRPSRGFNLEDPNMFLLKPTYNQLHDPALENYFKMPWRLRVLHEEGSVVNNNKVQCSLKEFNDYREYLVRLQKFNNKSSMRNKLLVWS